MTSTIAPSAVDSSAVDIAIDAASGRDHVSSILGSVPALAAVLEAMQQIDRLVASVVGGLIDLEDHGVAAATTHVALEQWMAIVGRRTRADRRMLLTTGQVCRRLPSLRAAFVDQGAISWAQMRSIVLATHPLPHRLDDRLDAGIAEAITRCTNADPDALAAQVNWVISDLTTLEQKVARPAPTDDFFAMQPRLDGSGGRVWGDLGPLGFATLDAALTTGPPATAARDGFAGSIDPERAGSIAQASGRVRAERLISLCERSLGDQRSGGRPTLLVRADLDTLLDRDRTPATLLTHLTGGRMWLDAATTRRLIDERGADLRTVVLDDTGRVVGVGRRRRTAPGWLRETLLAIHDTCTAPGCLASARTCDLDHARPWHPSRPGAVPGTTNVDQLAPLCRTDNRDKEASGWSVTQSPDGSRIWRHRFAGLTTRTIPGSRPPPSARAGPER